MIDDGTRRRVVAVLWVAVLLLVAYWVLWYADRPLLASNRRAGYYEFENAFPLADGWLALCCAAAARTLSRRTASALLWLLAAGGAGLYLLGMDVLYDVEHAIWWRSGAGGIIELAINVITATVSVVLLRWTWRHRRALLGPDAAQEIGNRSEPSGVAGSREAG